MKRAFLGLAIAACVLGLFFTSFSTYDFVQHLDRQVHGIHCSFIPGLDGTDVSGSSGCHVTLMSPYSSVLRDVVWGGVPVSLPGMAVFAFLLAYGLRLALRGPGRRDESGDAGFFALACALPVITSVGMGYLSLVTLGAACKLCIGTYAASGLAFLGAVVHWRAPGGGGKWEDAAEEGSGDSGDSDDWRPPMDHSNRHHVSAFGAGVAFVGLAIVGYIAMAPDFSGYVGDCGELADGEDAYDVLIPVGPRGGIPAVEILDPLCPSCKGLEERLAASDLGTKLDRRALMFPLDNACNWMVTSAVHPGACAVSEALLCAEEDQVDAVMRWAFDNQGAIKTASEADPDAAGRMAVEAFPGLKGCVGGAQVKARLNRSLRWAVANELPILTPQLYVDGAKVCDEDTDLGLDFALSRMLASHGGTP